MAGVTRRNINDVLARAQAQLRRLTPAEAAAAMADGWTLVDTRSEDVRARDGWIPGAIPVPLNVLEWRVDPESGQQHPGIAGHEDRLILICHEGFSSSLAALRLRELGYPSTTDVIGGAVAWAAAGLPVRKLGLRNISAATVVVDADRRVLLIHQAYAARNWEIPGGSGDPHESAEETAIRETREEAGVDVAIERLSGIYWDPANPAGMHHFVFRAHLTPSSPAPQVTDPVEIDDVRWFALDALPRPLSNRTVLRIEDALSDRPAGFRIVPPRTWLP